MSNSRVMVVVGTRPDAIKLAPVIRALREESSSIQPVVVATAQHREMLDQALDMFHIVPDYDLDVMTSNQGLVGLTSRVLTRIEPVLKEIEPSLLLVQGDTITAFAAGLAAFYSKVKVAHVEAGLRTHDFEQPFPEEASRHLLSVITELHFAPTRLARENLLRESTPIEKIVVTGNTVVDALTFFENEPVHIDGTPLAELPAENERILLVTSHRRESWGRKLESICWALRDIVERYDDVRVVYPVHLSPNVRQSVEPILKGIDRIHLLPPLDYATFLALMRRSYIILTDSGGIQEEAATFHKPLLCLRDRTERPEAFAKGTAKVVGTGRAVVFRETTRLLDDPSRYQAMVDGPNPYGDGRASERIVESLGRWFAGETPLLPSSREFGSAKPEKVP